VTAEIGGMRDDVSGMPVICANSSSQIRAREQVDFARYVSITKSRHMSRFDQDSTSSLFSLRNRVSSFSAFAIGMRMVDRLPSSAISMSLAHPSKDVVM